MGSVRRRQAADGPYAFGLLADCARARRASIDCLADFTGHVCVDAVADTAPRVERRLDRKRNSFRRAGWTARLYDERCRALQLGRFRSRDDLLFDYGIQFGG